LGEIQKKNFSEGFIPIGQFALTGWSAWSQFLGLVYRQNGA
jgi:hypothetical protein